MIDRQREPNLTVEYMADLDSEKYGSGFTKNPKSPYFEHPWNINNLRK